MYWMGFTGDDVPGGRVAEYAIVWSLMNTLPLPMPSTFLNNDDGGAALARWGRPWPNEEGLPCLQCPLQLRLLAMHFLQHDSPTLASCYEFQTLPSCCMLFAIEIEMIHLRDGESLCWRVQLQK